MQIVNRLNDDSGFYNITPTLYFTHGHLAFTYFGIGISWLGAFIEIHFDKEPPEEDWWKGREL